MLNNFIEMLQYDFIVYALIAGMALSICTALIGANLVLRKQSMIGDGLSHVAFGTTVIALTLNCSPYYLSIPIVITASILILRINHNKHINPDAAIALLSASSLAIGIIANSISSNKNVDINSYLFGSILTTSKYDLLIIIPTTIIIIALYLIFYRQFFSITVDEKFAKSIGINTKIYSIILATICSIVIVLGMRMLGALLVSSLIIFPISSARFIAKSYRSTLFIAVLLSIITFIFGITISFTYNLPSGATIVLANLACLFLCWVYNKLK